MFIMEGYNKMKIFIATDITIFAYQDKIYAQGKHSTILKRYYDAFGGIILCSRVKKIEIVAKGYVDITDMIIQRVSFNSLTGMLMGKYSSVMKRAIAEADLVIARCPSLTAYRAADYARKIKKPYLAECMGDAWDAYWNHGVVGKLIAPYAFLKMKRTVRHADYAVYVTTEFLQKRYPCKNGGIAASNVLIREVSTEVLENKLKYLQNKEDKAVYLMTTAAVDVRYKGQKYVIKAIPKLNKMGIRVVYNIVGEGNQEFLKKIIKKNKVEDQVNIVGRISLDEVLALLDQTEVYIQPSLQEGLPRAVIEAMSRACVCVGARTAGIPELLDATFVVKRKSVKDIVMQIKKYMQTSFEERSLIMNRNFNEAKKYASNILDERRQKYFAQIVKEMGEDK